MRRAASGVGPFWKSSLKMKDPSGGTTGRVQAIKALGVDGRSRTL
jgi:hypothetical protein